MIKSVKLGILDDLKLSVHLVLVVPENSPRL
ncbi:hypothetical protein NtB2_00965 [Lactococcus termiticola]|uniref:Uncharacterized protein n=1 Tax=Lactococcus termiticola TaxID=2169526 RepID=A0A2R5HJN2_9LACT|nr:hypothetical protein NtB2_00965 [Lactococcus termiticola]